MGEAIEKGSDNLVVTSPEFVCPCNRALGLSVSSQRQTALPDTSPLLPNGTHGIRGRKAAPSLCVITRARWGMYHCVN